MASLANWGIANDTITQLQNFVTPSNEARPLVRWWWVHGLVDPEEVRNEIGQLADAGFGGVELQDVHHSYNQGAVLGNLTEDGWAGPRWFEAVEASVDEIIKRNMRHDMALGPCWPLGVPGYTSDDVEAAKEIVFGKQLVNGTTYTGPIPEPWQDAADGVTKEELFSLQAWRLGEDSHGDAILLTLDKDSLVDLTDRVSNGNETITWSPPDNATWILLATRIRGTGQVPEDSPHSNEDVRVADHFAREATEAATKFWDERILPRIGDKLSASGSAVFEDSLELVATTHWTHRLPKEFLHRRGYNISTILPAFLLENSEPAFKFSDSAANEAAKNDFYDVLSSLYIEEHVRPLEKWTKSRGLRYRV